MDTRLDVRVLRGSLVRLRDGRAVGCTSYCTPRFYPERPGWYATEIGWTWLAASAQRTGINAEAKLLLMTYAFETLGVARVGVLRGSSSSAAMPPCLVLVSSADRRRLRYSEWPGDFKT